MRKLRTEKEIIDSWKGGSPSTPLVSICCITYNHESFIEDALEGFLIQETEFPFEILIHDDASTDNTADIIREYESAYPNIIKPIYQTENQYSKGNRPGLFNLERAKGKYIALCEGDDYWVDRKKIQKQVCFLENNKKCGICCTDYFVERNKVIKHYFDFYGEDFFSTYGIIKTKKVIEYPYETLLKHNFIGTLTTLFRSDLLDIDLREIIKKNYLMGDYPLWLYLSSKSKVYKLSETTAIYRYLDESLSHSIDENKRVDFFASSWEIRYDSACKNGKENIIIDEYKAFKKNQLRKYFVENNKDQFRSNYYKIAELEPFYIDRLSQKIKYVIVGNSFLVKYFLIVKKVKNYFNLVGIWTQMKMKL